MREIKFRAWHKEKRKMFPVTTIQFPTAFNPGYAGTLKEDGFDTLFPFDNQVILMQYTGLKDKNGVEIYEGDILKTNKGIICQVFYSQERARYVVKYPNIWADKPANIHKSLFWANVRSEIIGNIYENGDLLK